jgi:hypothetical protein
MAKGNLTGVSDNGLEAIADIADAFYRSLCCRA